jgi:hypothetical protein
LHPGEYLVIWCDDDEDQEGLHTTFRLNGDGEFLAIVSDDGATIIDSITFGEQVEDISLGRHPDGFESWRLLYPSPGSSNLGNPGITAPQPVVSALTATPNPTPGTTTLTFCLGEPATVALALFDMGGRAVWRREFPQLPPGEHTLCWHGQGENGRLLPPGVYICRMLGGQYRSALPIIKIR